MRFGDCVSDGEDQPVRGGRQDQAHLVGERAAAAGTIRGELSLVQLDQVLGLAAGAINRLTPAPMASSANPSNPLSGAIFVPSFLADIIETSRSTRYYHRR